MKNWQEQQRKKNHLIKVKNAKKTITVNRNNKQYSELDSKQNVIQQLAHLERGEGNVIPIYRLLKMYGLQQYAKQFVNRGYGIQIGKLTQLGSELDILMQQIKILPGHQLKLKALISYIYNLPMLSKGNTSFKQLNKRQQKIISDYSILGSEKSYPKAQLGKKDIKKSEFLQTVTKLVDKYSNITYVQQNLDKITDEVQDQEKNQIEEKGSNFEKSLKGEQRQNFRRDIEEAIQINQIISQYENIQKKQQKPTLSKKKDASFTNQNSFIRQKEKLSKTGPNTLLKKEKHIKQKSIQKQNNYDQKSTFQKKKNSQNKIPVSRSNIVKKQSKAKPQSNAKVLCKGMFQNDLSLKIDLQYNKAKDLNISFDGAKLTSTIINIDIQQLCYCMAQVIRQMMKQIPANFKEQQMPQQIQEHLEDQINFQESRQQIEEVLRDSFMYYQKNNKQMAQSSFLATQSFKFGLKKQEDIFNQVNPEIVDQFKPSAQALASYIKNIMHSAKMERQIPIMALVYIQNYLKNTSLILHPLNHKRQTLIIRIVLVSLMIASKTWDDQSFQTPSFSQAFPIYTTVLLNQMQKVMLKGINYRLKIEKYEYSMMYFRMRSKRKSGKKSFPLKKIGLNQVLLLQRGKKGEVGIQKNGRKSF